MDHRHGPADREASPPEVPDLAKFFEERTARQDSTAQQAAPPSDVGTEDALTTPSSSSGDENERPRPVPEEDVHGSQLSGSTEAPSIAPSCDDPGDPLVAQSANVLRVRMEAEANRMSSSTTTPPAPATAQTNRTSNFMPSPAPRPTAAVPAVVRTQTGGWIRTDPPTRETEQAIPEQDGPATMQAIAQATGQDNDEEWHNTRQRRVSTERFVQDVQERTANASQRPGHGEIPDEDDRRPPPRLPDLPPADATTTYFRYPDGQTGLYTPVQPIQVSHVPISYPL